jgi:hypothetical protein
LENQIIKEFNNKFKLIAGNEYFQGNEKEMKKLFLQIIENHEMIYNSDNDNSDYIIENENNCNNDYSIDEIYEANDIDKNDYNKLLIKEKK